MRMDINADGIVYLTLEEDEQVIVDIGGAELWCTGGIVNNPGEGPLVQIMLQDATAYLDVKHRTPRDGRESYDVRVVPEELEERPEADAGTRL